MEILTVGQATILSKQLTSSIMGKASQVNLMHPSPEL